MAVNIKKRDSLKLVVDDLSMLLVCTSSDNLTIGTGTNPTVSINPDYELPVTVDTLQTTGGEPTISHYKVIGLDGDWTSSSTPGEWTVQFTVPTLHTDVLKFAFGATAVKTLGTITAGDNFTEMTHSGGTWSGVGVGLTSNKITCGLAIANGAKDKIVVFKSVDLYAHIMKEANGDPYCVQFNGTVTADGANDMLVLQHTAGQ